MSQLEEAEVDGSWEARESSLGWGVGGGRRDIVRIDHCGRAFYVIANHLILVFLP